MRPAPTLQNLYRDIVPDLGGVEDRILRALDSEKPEIAELAAHANGAGGKRMRPAMVLLVARAAGRLTDQHVSLAAVVEMIHLATLVHDDVIDQADLRHRNRTVRALWNPRDAVLLGDIIFARAIRLLASMGDPRSLTTLTDALSVVCEGEILQNRRAHDPELSEQVYYEVIDAKTAELYARGCELAAHLAGATPEGISAFETFGRELGLAFQVTDDCLDLIGEEAEVGKSLGTDLTGGKMTLPLILLRGRLEGEPRRLFDRVISEGVASPEDVTVMAELLRSHGVVAEALERARSHIAAATEAVRGHASQQDLAILEAIGEFVLSRSL